MTSPATTSKLLPSTTFFRSRHHLGLIIRVNIFLKPGIAWLFRVHDEIPALELAHLAPIRAHSIHHIRTGRHERSKTLLALRSEEHTSELQSPCKLVCRLLLE